MLKLADRLVSEASVGNDVRVQVPPRPQQPPSACLLARRWCIYPSSTTRMHKMRPLQTTMLIVLTAIVSSMDVWPQQNSASTTVADSAKSNASQKAPPVDPRERTLHTLQVRMGMYRVIMPASVKPAQTFPAVMVLHGNGNTPEMMMQWAKTLKLDSAILIFPQAPYPKIEEIIANQSARYSASGKGIGFPDSMQADIVDASSSWYNDVYLDAAARLPISKAKPIVIGFSQGGFHALTLITRFPHIYRGAATICASMYDYGKVQEHLKSLRVNGVDVLITHGTADAVVPYQTGELITAWLKTAGVNHTFVPFQGGHWPNAEITSVISDWVRQRLP